MIQLQNHLTSNRQVSQFILERPSSYQPSSKIVSLWDQLSLEAVPSSFPSLPPCSEARAGTTLVPLPSPGPFMGQSSRTGISDITGSGCVLPARWYDSGCFWLQLDPSQDRSERKCLPVSGQNYCQRNVREISSPPMEWDCFHLLDHYEMCC